MAIVFFEDFEHGSTLRFASTAGMGFATGVATMYGRCLFADRGFADWDKFARYDLGTNRSQGLISFAYSSESLPTASYRIFSAMNSGTHQVGLYLNSNGTLSVSRDTTILGTTPIIYTAANLRYRIELGFEISDAAGTYTLKINGTQYLNATSQDTRNGVDGFDRIQIGGAGVSRNHFDDILLDDDKTAFRGDFYGLARVPVSDVSGYSTPSTGVNRWATIDELPYSATDYNSFPATGEDKYGMQPLSNTPDNIYGVCVNWISRKTDTGTCDMRSILYSGSATANGTTRTLNVASQFFQDIHQLDPNTSSAWSASAVNALTVGKERTA